ncbi:hypothetical protein [Candidatus Poriferisodalis sp.]|uniref:hypothetical protein n=1 Tax=Candidatus Poriferisodalis sp. TaxID=3101277 RepID=UPI003B01B9CD
MAKSRPRAATREQVEAARSRAAERPLASDPPSSPHPQQTPQPEPQGRLWDDGTPPRPAGRPAPEAADPGDEPTQQARPSRTPRRRVANRARLTPESRYRNIADQLEHVAQMRQRYLDAAAAKKQAHDDWLEAAHNAASNGVQVQDLAAQCGITRSGLYQTLYEWRRKHRR